VIAMGIIKRDRVRLDAAENSPARPAARSPKHTGKSARLVRLEGRVVGIEITCSCGEASFVELEFDGAPEAADGEA
jgi:hypothetical protein